MLQREAFYVTNTKPITWKICKSVVGWLTITKYRSIQDIITAKCRTFLLKNLTESTKLHKEDFFFYYQRLIQKLQF